MSKSIVPNLKHLLRAPVAALQFLSAVFGAAGTILLLLYGLPPSAAFRDAVFVTISEEIYSEFEPWSDAGLYLLIASFAMQAAAVIFDWHERSR